MKRRFAFFWAVHPLQGLVESLLAGLLILAATARLEGYVEWFVFQAALFFLCGVCGMWAVLRIRIPRGGWLKQTAWELAVGLGLSLVMTIGLRNLSLLLKWDAVWRLSTWEEEAIALLFFSTGPGYFLARGGVRLWLRWEQMRRQRMLWALTHSYLMVIVTFAVLVTFGTLLMDPVTGIRFGISTQAKEPPISFITSSLMVLFPILVFTIVLGAIVLALALPPMAVFSYFMARRTTRRLEALTSVTAALRSGNYDARVRVDGEDEVAHLQADFNGMAEKLAATLTDLKSERDTVAEVLRARRDLIANVSHELRTPVATLRATIETALDHWQNVPAEDLRRRLEIMDAEVLRLSDLIDDLFTLSQAEVDHLSVVCAPVELPLLVEQVVSEFAPFAWESARVEVVADLPADLPPVWADAKRLQQVLLNLLRNGVRHTPPGGIVAITAREEESTVRIEVRDTGEGIDPADLPHVFERFYRGKNAAPEGAGLGLALVKELVEAMAGCVNVQSEPGEGSRFIVQLKKA
jgi:signal transduction histidine kinase